LYNKITTSKVLELRQVAKSVNELKRKNSINPYSNNFLNFLRRKK